MRKIPAIFVLLVFFSCNLCAQIKDSVLIDCFGQIRSDMVREVCKFVNFNNDSILKTISNESLNDFKKNIVKKDTLLGIINVAIPLSGTDIIKYHDNIEATRKAFRDKLEFYYPTRNEEIEDTFKNYIVKIEELTKECKAYNTDKDNYLTLYPSGRFVKFFAEIDEKGNSDLNNKDSIKTINNSQEDKTKVEVINKSEGGFSSFVKGMFFGAIILFVMYYFFKRRNKKASNKEQDKKGSDIKGTSNNNEKEVVVSQKEIITSKPVPDTTSLLNEKTDNKESIKDDSQKDKPRKEENIEIVQSGEINETEKKSETPKVFESSPKEEKTIPIPTKTFDPIGKCMAIDAGEWIVVGASVQGNGHISMNMPCQDNHGYEYLGDGWGIAITSDGAGSAKLSHMGSAATVSRAMLHFKELVEKEGWKNMSVLPSDGDWIKKSYKVLKRVRDELEALANKNKCGVKDLSATIITVIHSPLGLLVAHIGDGRAGYKDMSGEWHSVITPHKGEEANQTIFIPSDFWNIPFYEMSGATVPESRVIRDKVAAFTLMSDGCENTSWLCNQFNETSGKYYDPNVPYKKFFDPLLNTLQSYRENNITIEERKEKWYSFIKEGNNSFVRETDDKTMILGALYM